MKFIGFLILLGGTYGIAHAALGASNGWASGIAWAVAVGGAFIAWRARLYRAYAHEVMASPEYQENARRAEQFFGHNTSSDFGDACPACGHDQVTREAPVWVCGNCAANGPVVGGISVDVGLRGNPRTGEYEQYRSQMSVARQLCPYIPELAQFTGELGDRLDLAYYDWYYQLTGTSFDIEDADLQAAEAVRARNVLGDPAARADDARFYGLTAASTAGWQWRRSEQVGYDPSAPELAHVWAERYLDGTRATGRSETIGLIADAVADVVALEAHSPGGEELGFVFLNAGWLLTHSNFFEPQPQLAAFHPMERLHDAFRFGVALRDAQVAYDAAARER